MNDITSRDDWRAHEWRQNFPQLTDCPDLIEELKRNNHLRRRLFRYFQILDQIAHMPDHRIAMYLIGLVIKEGDRKFYGYEPAFRARVEANGTQEWRAYNQMIRTWKDTKRRWRAYLYAIRVAETAAQPAPPEDNRERSRLAPRAERWTRIDDKHVIYVGRGER